MDRDGWMMLIRRSLGVPDLIGSEAAELYMGEWVMKIIPTEMVEVDFKTNERWRDAVALVIADIATAGAEGYLDDLLVGLSSADFDSAATTVTNDSNYGSRATVEATKHVLERIEEFVYTHKFQAGCGCHFN